MKEVVEIIILARLDEKSPFKDFYFQHQHQHQILKFDFYVKL